MIRLTVELTSDGVKAQVKLIPARGSQGRHTLSIESYVGRTVIQGEGVHDVLAAFAAVTELLAAELAARAQGLRSSAVQFVPALFDGGPGELGPIEGLHDSFYDDDRS